MENKDYISKEGINVITHSDNFELETFEMAFIKWIRGFKKNVLDVEFKGDRCETETEVSDNKISFRSTIKWGLEIERIDGHPSPVDPDEEDDSEDLKMEKANNKKNGVEITETFPWPEFDSGVPQEDESEIN
tara:strand:- start:122 stop:517 length:396 start_codon:yes stop_codon:yes gene_type:complete